MRPGSHRPRLARSLGLVGGLLLALAVMGPAAGAQLNPDQIVRFAVAIDVNRDGSLHVVEDIDVRFNTLRRGIIRAIPVRYDLAPEVAFELPHGEPSDWLRETPLTGLQVDSPTMATDLQLTEPGRFDGAANLQIRIGDEDIYDRGEHHYTISYDIAGALDDGSLGTELYWNATGVQWDMPIQEAVLVVRGPGLRPETATCFAGGYRSTLPCDAVHANGSEIRFEASDLGRYEGLTGAVAFDPAVVAAGEPILVERWTPLLALWGNGLAWPLTVLTAALGLGGVGRLMYRQGRDRVARGGITVDSRVDAAEIAEPRRFGQARVVPVEFRPPDDLRPAELGLIIDERVDAVDVSATVVDLAVRGYVTIEEVEEKKLVFTKTDWRLTKVDRPWGDLHNYERFLLNGLFEDGDTVMVNDLKGSFASEYQKVQRSVYEQGRKRAWFNGRPDKVRAKWAGIAAVSLVASLGLAALSFAFTQVAIAAVPLVLASFVLLLSHQHMPHRTAKGSAMLTRTLGFKEFIEQAEADRMAFAERENIFVSYLPYAVVFGATEKWAQTFENLGIDTAAAVGGFYYGAHVHGFNAARFSEGMNGFASSVGTSLSTVPSSSSGGGFSGGGFSGGGFGGGGGSSW